MDALLSVFGPLEGMTYPDYVTFAAAVDAEYAKQVQRTPALRHYGTRDMISDASARNWVRVERLDGRQVLVVACTALASREAEDRLAWVGRTIPVDGRVLRIWRTDDDVLMGEVALSDRHHTTVSIPLVVPVAPVNDALAPHDHGDESLTDALVRPRP